MVKPGHLNLLACFLGGTSLLILPAWVSSAMTGWSANFSRLISTRNWNVYDSAPFRSTQNDCFMASNTFVANGVLNLVVDTSPNTCHLPYSSGGLDTYTAHAQNYGTWTVRAKFPRGQGVTGYLGLFVSDGTTWPPEVDFAEVTGNNPQTLYLTQHYTANGQDLSHSVPYTTRGTDWTRGYHTYTLKWKPGTLYYYVDNHLVLTQPQLFRAPPQKMMLAIGTGTGDAQNFVGDPPPNFRYARMQVSAVSITPLG